MAENPQDKYNEAPEPAAQPAAAPQPRVGWTPPQAPAGQGAAAPVPPVWGAPPPKPAPGAGLAARTSPLKKGLIAAGIAVVLAAGAGAAVYAANGSSSDGASAQAPGLGQYSQFGGQAAPEGSTDGQLDGQLGGPMGQGGMGGPGDLGMGAAGALHGEYVVQNDGGYATMATQSGTVSSVGDGTVTVESADGFKQSYTLADDTVVSSGGFGRGRDQTQQGTLDSGDLATGQTVRVTALKDGSALTATLVLVLDTGTGSTGTGSTGTDSSTGTGTTS
jgi:hypothetical protein